MDEEAVRSVIADHLAVTIDQVIPEARFTDLGADSLDLITLTMRLEEEFDVPISDEQATECRRVSDAFQVLRAAALQRA